MKIISIIIYGICIFIFGSGFGIGTVFLFAIIQNKDGRFRDRFSAAFNKYRRNKKMYSTICGPATVIAYLWAQYAIFNYIHHGVFPLSLRISLSVQIFLLMIIFGYWVLRGFTFRSPHEELRDMLTHIHDEIVEVDDQLKSEGYDVHCESLSVEELVSVYKNLKKDTHNIDGPEQYSQEALEERKIKYGKMRVIEAVLENMGIPEWSRKKLLSDID